MSAAKEAAAAAGAAAVYFDAVGTEETGSKAPAAEAAVPEAAPACPAPSGDGVPIWIIASGNRGGTLTALPLAITLQNAGYRVRVLTLGMFRKCFDQYGIATDSIDDPLWKCNTQTVTFLRMKASLEGETDRSRDDIDDIVLHLTMLKVEYLNWRAMTMFKTGKLMEIPPILSEIESFVDKILGEDPPHKEWWEFHGKQLNEYLESEAQRLDMELADLKAVRERRRRELLKEIKRRAAIAGVMPFDFLQTFHFYVKGHMGFKMQAFATGQTSMEAVNQEFLDFFSWVKGRPADKYLDMMFDKFPPVCQCQEFDVVGVIESLRMPDIFKNIWKQVDACPEKDLPRLVLAFAGTRSIGLTAADRAGCRCVPFFTEMQPLQGEVCTMIFSMLADQEKQGQLSIAPFRERGPVDFTDECRTVSRQLLFTPPSMVRDHSFPPDLLKEEGFKQSFIDGALGPMLVDTERQLECNDPGLFGDAEIRRQLEAFVAAGSPPVCVTLGLLPTANALKLLELFVTALRLSQQRCVFLHRWWKMTPEVAEGLGEEDKAYFKENVLLLHAAPHGWLFPRCSCVFTNGGRNSFAAALKAGVPILMAIEEGESPKTPILKSMRLHESVFTVKETFDRLSSETLSKGIRHVMESEKLKEAAKKAAEEAKQWPSSQGVVETVQRLLQDNGAGLAEKQAAMTRGPWVEGEYDSYLPDGKYMARVSVLMGRAEVPEGPIMWFRAGSFKKKPPRLLNKPWLQTNEEVTYDVEISFPSEQKIQHAQISPDGQTWTFDDGGRMVYRANVPKACQCVVS